MARKKRTDIRTIATRLAYGKPLAYKLRDDGTLAVIGPKGKKLTFSAAQVRAVRTAEEGAASTESEKEGL